MMPTQPGTSAKSAVQQPTHGSLSKTERSIVEALKNSLSAGLLNEESPLHGMLDQVAHDVDETSHTSQFRWEGIDDAYKLKIAGDYHEDAISSAFFHTHSYKYLDNPTFKLAFETELRNRAVPENSIKSALGHVESLIGDLSSNPGERDSGWNPDMGGIVDVTSNADDRSADHSDPFTGGGNHPDNDNYDKGKLEGF